jgi:hypothetical protein
MDKTDSGWSAPRHLPAPVNSDADSYYPIVLKNGTLYFGSERGDSRGLGDIYRAVPQKDGGYTVENLGPPVNTSAGEYEAFVTEDERLLLLYLSHKQADGKWSEPINLGPKINSPARELSPKTHAKWQIPDLDELPRASIACQTAAANHGRGVKRVARAWQRTRGHLPDRCLCRARVKTANEIDATPIMMPAHWLYPSRHSA